LAKSKVLDVGNCGPDHATLGWMLSNHFDVEIDRALCVDDALERMRACEYELVLVNRLIFDDASPGKRLIEDAKADKSIRKTPIMMISNFDDAQQDAVAAGAEPGFGKNDIFADSTVRLLSNYLPAKG